ncbi:MAG: AAC(3) family N-acetyltransferase [Spirochaetales bacterium]|nr:AAC(3) family N-acetyltransferase [Spirochaetales bacterium]
MPYTIDDIKKAYIEAGVTEGRVVLLKTDLRYLGPSEITKRSQILAAHYNALADIIDLTKGTIVVSTASDSLYNTDTPFDPATTPSERGILTEYIRTSPGSVRSFHPFISYTAIGAHAEQICCDVTRHGYGLESPKDRMFKLDALYLSVGLEPRWTCSYVHHMEQLMGVPYRYTKEFEHPVVRDGKIVKELFYSFLYYYDIDLDRNINVNLFKHFSEMGFNINEASLGTGKVYGYDLVDFHNTCCDFFKKNIYGWLTTPPTKRPYRK